MSKLTLQAYYDKHTRSARTGQELQFQKDLTALDKDLHLRWSYLKESWCVYYDHNHVLSSIAAIAPDESFREAYQKIAKNGAISKRDFMIMHEESLAENEQQAQKVIDDANEQAAHEVGNMERGRVISTVTDSKKSSIVG